MLRDIWIVTLLLVGIGGGIAALVAYPGLAAVVSVVFGPVLAGVCVLALYLLPSLIAYGRGHQRTVAILLFNLLLGWTFLGWALALIWSTTAVIPETPQARH